MSKWIKKNSLIHDYMIRDAILNNNFFNTNDVFNKILSNFKDKKKLDELQKNLPSGADNVLKNRIRWMIFNLKKKNKIIKVKNKKGIYKVL